MSGTCDLRVEGLRKAFGRTEVLNGLDLEVPAGALAAVLGVSGSGKTTLLRIVAGFERADAGEVRLDAACVESPEVHVRAERRRIGYVAQEGSLFPHLDARANVAFGLAWRERRGRRPDELLDAVGLAPLARRYPHELSGGQQQRVALARALATRPRLVLLDEPFAGLDATMRAAVRAEVLALLREAGTTALLVTHDQDEALSSADLVAVLRAGRVVQAASPRELYEHPVDADVASFVGEANLLGGTAAGTSVRTALGELPWRRPAACPPGSRLTVLVRPEQLELRDGGASAPAVVVSNEFHGHDTTVTVRTADPALPEALVARVPGGAAPAPGAPVELRVRGAVEAWAAGP